MNGKQKDNIYMYAYCLPNEHSSEDMDGGMQKVLASRKHTQTHTHTCRIFCSVNNFKISFGEPEKKN